MTTIAQMKNINAYVEAFIAEHGDENMVELWQDEEVQKQFNKLINATKKDKGSGKKDPNKPKRGKSAYIFFCAEHREKAKETLGEGAKATEVTAELGRQWNELKASTKASDKKKLEKYEELAREDKERYESEMADYSPKESNEDPEATQIIEPEKVGEKKVGEKKVGEKKVGEKKDSGKKITGYVLFCKEHREKVVEDNPEIKGAEITKILAGMWKELTSEEQEEWKHRASIM